MGSRSSAWVIAAVTVATASMLDLNPIRDGLTDDVISPSCRIGSLQSWQGLPCVISERDRFDQRNGG